MRANIKSLIAGIFFLLLPRIYFHFISNEGGIISLIAIVFVTLGTILIIYSFAKKESYKITDMRNGKIFEIKSLYTTPWETRVGISFKNKEAQYFISPIPKELKDVSCGEKYCKIKNKIIKI